MEERGRPGRFELCALLLGFGLFSPGCGLGATQEFALRHPELGARSTRLTAGTALVARGPILGGELVARESEGAVAVRSAAFDAGYGWENVVPNDCVEVGAHVVGRLAGGKPALADEDAVHFGGGLRGELTLSPARDLHAEKFTLLFFRPELVALFDTTIWTIGGDRALELSAGLGVRLTAVSNAGPPLLRWLGAIL